MSRQLQQQLKETFKAVLILSMPAAMKSNFQNIYEMNYLQPYAYNCELTLVEIPNRNLILSWTNYISCSPENVFCFEIYLVLSTNKVDLYSTLPNQK